MRGTVVAVAGLVAVTTGCRIGFDPLGVSADTSGAVDAAPGTSSDGKPVTMAVDAAPDTVIPMLAADSYIAGNDASPNGNDLEVRCGRLSGSGNNLWALWRFDLSTVALGSVSSATLRLYQYGAAGAMTMDFEVYRVTAAWDEATVDWTHANATTTWTPGAPISSNVYATAMVTLGAYGFYDWDVTGLVNEWLAGTANHGLEMQYVTQPAPGNFAVFASKEHPTTAWRPQLLLTP